MPPIGADRHALYENAVVLDLGGHTLKAGLAAAFPAAAEPRVVGFLFFSLLVASAWNRPGPLRRGGRAARTEALDPSGAVKGL